jgi:hypothetical protein
MAPNFTLDRLDSQTEYERVLAVSEGSRRTWKQITDSHFNIDPVNLRNIVSLIKNPLIIKRNIENGEKIIYNSSMMT